MWWPRSRTRAQIEALDAKLAELRLILDESYRLSAEALAKAQRSERDAAAEPQRHTTWLAASVLLCFLGATILTTMGSQTFSEPIALAEAAGAIEVAWATDNPEIAEYAEINDTHAWVEVVTSEQFGSMSLDVWFPSNAAGLEFLVVLKGAAQFEEFSQPGLRTEPHECEAFPGVVEECQFIYGLVPDADKYNPIAGNACVSLSKERGGSTITLSGKTNAVQESNWAYNVIASPAIYGETFATRLTNYEEVELPGQFAFADIGGCKIVETSIARIVVETDPRPEGSRDDFIVWWLNDFNGATTVVTKERRANTTGQILLAFGAAIAGLGIGLVSVAFEAHRSNKMQKRRVVAASPP